MRQFYTLLYIVALFSCSLVFACKNHFAHLTSYPIMRTYPTKWIEKGTHVIDRTYRLDFFDTNQVKKRK